MGAHITPNDPSGSLHTWAQSGSLYLLTLDACDNRNSEENGHYTDDRNFNLDPILEAAMALKFINSHHTPARLSRRGPIHNIMNMAQIRSTYSVRQPTLCMAKLTPTTLQNAEAKWSLHWETLHPIPEAAVARNQFSRARAQLHYDDYQL
jgi:hypothetical protein